MLPWAGALRLSRMRTGYGGRREHIGAVGSTWRPVKDKGESAGAPAGHMYGLGGMTRTYVPTGIHRGRLKVLLPFPLDIDLDTPVP